VTSAQDTRALERRLATAEATIEALLSGEIDAVVDSKSKTPVLLAKAQEALLESERLYRSTFDASPVGIVHVGLDGRWLRVNQRLCDLLGYSSGELQGPAVEGLLQPDTGPAEAEAAGRMAAGTLERHVVDEKSYRRSDGTRMWARVNMSVHRDTAGRPQHLISVIEDVTERRTLDEQLRQANKMDAIGKLASGVAHDFNNLLTVIIGFAELALREGETPDQRGTDLGEIVKAAQRGAGLTHQLLAFSRQQVLRAAPVNINAVVTDMVGMLGRLIGEHIEVSLALAPHLSLALADRGQLEQVLMNLVVNARDAMPEGGTLTIATMDVSLENPALDGETVMTGQYVMLAVTDTGTGMSGETKRRLFEPFFTTKDPGKGTGLGLSTSYGIVKQSQGYLWVDSELGVGTTFKVYLPRSTRDAPLQAVSSSPAPTGESASATILLVEDELSLRRLTKRLLDKAGYRVIEATNGDEAENIFAAAGDAIDLLVTDVIMPGCGGPELLSRLRVSRPTLPVLYMSGYTSREATGRAYVDPDLPFVQKPFTAAEFVRQVRDALSGRNSGRTGTN
jgi:two-component system cell cycle sensor histidine kinase/response regulator CckA